MILSGMLAQVGLVITSRLETNTDTEILPLQRREVTSASVFYSNLAHLAASFRLAFP